MGHHLKLNPSWDLFNFKRLMGPISVFESRSRDDKSELNRIKQFKTHQLQKSPLSINRLIRVYKEFNAQTVQFLALRAVQALRTILLVLKAIQISANYFQQSNQASPICVWSLTISVLGLYYIGYITFPSLSPS